MRRRTINRFGELKIFVKVAEAGSFKGAAQQLGMASSTIGRSIARLEERLGVALFERTKSRNRLTLEGDSFYQGVVRILADLEEAERGLARPPVS